MTVLAALDAAIAMLRPVLLGVAVALAGVAAADWMVRTRRINPFGRFARIFRTSVDPLMMPVERAIVRAGGLPSSAPWWTLLFVVITGILLLTALGVVREQVALVVMALDQGARGLYRLAVSWTFTVLQLAIIVRVVMSWVRLRPTAWYVRWAWRLSEPVLGPVRRIVPLFGGIDVSPIVAWFLLSVVETVLIRLW